MPTLRKMDPDRRTVSSEDCAEAPGYATLFRECDLHPHRQLQYSARARRLPRVAGALCRRAPARDHRGGQWLERRLGGGRTAAVSSGATGDEPGEPRVLEREQSGPPAGAW